MEREWRPCPPADRRQPGHDDQRDQPTTRRINGARKQQQRNDERYESHSLVLTFLERLECPPSPPIYPWRGRTRGAGFRPASTLVTAMHRAPPAPRARRRR